MLLMMELGFKLGLLHLSDVAPQELVISNRIQDICLASLPLKEKTLVCFEVLTQVTQLEGDFKDK